MADYNPFVKVEKGQNIDPFIRVDQTDNSIIITKDNKEFVKGDLIMYTYRGQTIVTDIDNKIIINDNQNPSIIIKNDEKNHLTEPENRPYLILFVGLEDNELEIDNLYQKTYGRQATFNALVAVADDINFDETILLAETTKYKDAITAREFLEMCLNAKLVDNPTDFELSAYDYDLEEDEEDDEEEDD